MQKPDSHKNDEDNLSKDEITLDRLQAGKTALVSKIETEGIQRRRFSDLGIIQGTEIEAVMESPLGELTAYFIKGTLIAIRKEDSQKIRVNIKV